LGLRQAKNDYLSIIFQNKKKEKKSDFFSFLILAFFEMMI